MELEILDRMEKPLLPLVLRQISRAAASGGNGNSQSARKQFQSCEIRFKAIDKVLKIQERRAKLLGLDLPVKVEAEVRHKHLTLDELEQRMAERRAMSAESQRGK